MRDDAYRWMADLEVGHWWYRGRRAAIRRLLERLELPRPARSLDVGAGTGGNLALLDQFGHGIGVEPSPLGRDLSAARGRLIPGRADELPFREHSFDLVTCLDVLEHLSDELVALDEMRRVLKPGGALVLHVPAYQILWGHEDVISNHLRRYTATQIRRLLLATGFDIAHLGYTFVTLFPIIAAAKIGKRLLFRGDTIHADIDRMPSPLINAALTALVEIEGEVTGTAALPFGASILCAARSPSGHA